MKKNAKKNNKGFSLVELIIVVAIMAILIGVLGGQYLKFVERSRKSADQSNVDEIVRAVQIYAADPDATKTVKTGDQIKITTSSASIETDQNGAIALALSEAGISLDKLKLKSKEWGADCTITFTVTNGNVSATVLPVEIAGGTPTTTP